MRAKYLVSKKIMQPPNKDDVERLSRGQPTKFKIGSRRQGHRLTQKERILFEAAQRQGFLKIPAAGIRANVLNIYRLWCQAEGREFVIKKTEVETK
jgi:hypothetical protein